MNWIKDHGLEILVASLLTPIALGMFTGIVLNDFSAGAGGGAFMMIFAWFVLAISLFIPDKNNR